jgi:hypothetical protein
MLRRRLMLAVCLVLVACGASEAGNIADAGVADTSTGGDPPTDASSSNDGGLSCALPDLTGVTPVQVTFASGDPPTQPTGGSVQPGVYVATSAVGYVGDASVPPNPAFQEALVTEFTAGELRTTRADTRAGMAPIYSVGPYTVSGNTITFTRRCSSAADVVGKSVAYRFSADGTTYTVYTASSTYLLVTTHKRR